MSATKLAGQLAERFGRDREERDSKGRDGGKWWLSIFVPTSSWAILAGATTLSLILVGLSCRARESYPATEWKPGGYTQAHALREEVRQIWNRSAHGDTAPPDAVLESALPPVIRSSAPGARVFAAAWALERSPTYPQGNGVLVTLGDSTYFYAWGKYPVRLLNALGAKLDRRHVLATAKLATVLSTSFGRGRQLFLTRQQKEERMEWGLPPGGRLGAMSSWSDTVDTYFWSFKHPSYPAITFKSLTWNQRAKDSAVVSVGCRLDDDWKRLFVDFVSLKSGEWSPTMVRGGDDTVFILDSN